MLRRLRIEEGWFTFFLVWALVTIAAAAILTAEIMPGLDMLPFIGTVGVLTGLVLAKSNFSGRTAHIFALVYGLFLVTYLLGRTLPDDLTWRERVFDLVVRQYEWIQAAVSKGASRDGLIFIMHTSGVFWLLGYTAAWFTFRKPRIWWVVLPSGLVLLSVIYYYFGPKPLIAFLALYTLVALIFISRTHLVAKERTWRSASVSYEKGIRFTFLQASFLIALLALGISWGLPTAQASSAVGDALGETGFTDTWTGFQDTWTRLFSSLRSYGAGTSDAYRDTLSLGGPRTPGSTLIMDVFVLEQIPYIYWQAVVYDTYEEGAWSISESDQTLHFPSEGQIRLAPTAMREEVLQTVINYVPNAGTIHGAPEIVNTNRQMYVTHSQDDAGNAIVHQVQSRFVMRQGEKYQVLSRYSNADATSLREASTEYSAWVTEKYLQLPDSITPETVALSGELTAEHDNPFDKAIAVRNYLRRNIAYNDQISAPPPDVEPVHYILFDRQEAYCNYYASAMVMMLRSQGVPSRFVAGYAQGEWDEESSSYRVRASNAHSWVEVYFPGYGWIQFEPTASIPAGDRPETSENPGDAFGAESQSEDDLSGPDELGLDQPEDDFERMSELLGEEVNPFDEVGANQGAVKPWQVISASLVVLLGAVVVFVGNNMNRRVESNVEKSYGRLGNWGRWLGLSISPAQTPYERASLLGTAVPEGKEPLRNIVHQFVRQRFSPEGSSDADFDPRAEWKVLRPLMIRQTIAHQIDRLRGKAKKK